MSVMMKIDAYDFMLWPYARTQNHTLTKWKMREGVSAADFKPKSFAIHFDPKAIGRGIGCQSTALVVKIFGSASRVHFIAHSANMVAS